VSKCTWQFVIFFVVAGDRRRKRKPKPTMPTSTQLKEGGERREIVVFLRLNNLLGNYSST
jgi:hypothetical protein